MSTRKQMFWAVFDFREDDYELRAVFTKREDADKWRDDNQDDLVLPGSDDKCGVVTEMRMEDILSNLKSEFMSGLRRAGVLNISLNDLDGKALRELYGSPS